MNAAEFHRDALVVDTHNDAIVSLMWVRCNDQELKETHTGG